MPLDINNPVAMRGWSMEGDTQVTQLSFIRKNDLIRPQTEAENAIIVAQDGLGKKMNGPGAGYDITFDLLGAAEGVVETGNAPVDGTEDTTKYFSDKHTLNYRRKAFITTGKFDDQLSLHSGRNDIMTKIKNFWPEYEDTEFIAKVCGAKGSGVYRFFDASINPVTQGRDVRGSIAADGNLVRPPSLGRHVLPNGKTSVNALANTDLMTLDVIDAAVLQAITPDKNTTNSRLCVPVKREGEDACVAIVDFQQVAQLWQATGGRFFVVHLAEIQGGKTSVLNSKSANMPSLVMKYPSPYGVMVYVLAYARMPRFLTTDTGPDGSGGTTTYGAKAIRGCVLFQDAARITQGKDDPGEPGFNLYEELRDAGAKLRITASMTKGVQKTSFSTTETGNTRQDNGVVVFDTYANW